jgi:phosphate transport system substrate-binding protein
VSPTAEAFQAAAANVERKSQPGYGVILANQPGNASRPMTARTWILAYEKPQDSVATAEALEFFVRSCIKGGKVVEEPHYVATPANEVKEIEKTWSSEITDSGGGRSSR